MQTYDLIVIGGGIGGSALAGIMARAGHSVLVLEKSEVFEDHVRGEWISPWGVVETQRLGLYDLLVDAGGHHLTSHVTYDETRAPSEAETAILPLGIFAPGIAGPLCIGHPHHCQTLFDHAAASGATMLRGVDVLSVAAGDAPGVAYTHKGERREARARLLVGADGRNSSVRESLGIPLHVDRPHHMFGGMLVGGVTGWDETRQAIGTEGDFAFLAFPQGGDKVRVYGSFALDERSRFSGPGGGRKFLDAFAMNCSPENRHLVDGRPAGPLLSYVNADSWTDVPFADGAVLIGDAAGWNDPIIGLGLSITYRDVRIVTDLLLGAQTWTPALFVPYAEERAERMRRLRFVAKISSSLDAEFGEGPRARRADYFRRAAADPSLSAHMFAIMGGPEVAPPETFTETYRERVLGSGA